MSEVLDGQAGFGGDAMVRPALQDGVHTQGNGGGDDTEGLWTDQAIAFWSKLTDPSRAAFRSPLWSAPDAQQAERTLDIVRFSRAKGLALDDLLSMATWDDGFGMPKYREFHLKTAREQWEQFDKQDRERPAAEKPVLRLRYGFEATILESMGTVVAGLLHRGSLTLVYGPPKSGKSFLFTDLALGVADEEQPQWMGHEIVQHGPVLYVACEGHAGFPGRLTAAAKERGWDRNSFPKGFILATGRPKLIKVDESGFHYAPDASSILAALDDAKRRGLKPVAIIIDTVFRSFGAGNVNASPDMNVYLAAVAELTDQGYAVALVHHEIKSGGTPAGSVSLIGGADNIIRTWRESEDSPRRFWEVEMAKDDAETPPRAFTLGVVDIGLDADGRPASSCVVRGEGADANAGKRQKGRPPAETSAEAVLASLIYTELCNLLADPREGEEVSIHPDAPPIRAISRDRLRVALNRAGILETPDDPADAKRVATSNRSKVHRALNRLKRQGKIAMNDEYVGLAVKPAIGVA
jgi:KaiC/GvpD/RAD55 family RecA-like ATPase